MKDKLLFWLYKNGLIAGLVCIALPLIWDMLKFGWLGCLENLGLVVICWKGILLILLGVFLILGFIYAEHKIDKTTKPKK